LLSKPITFKLVKKKNHTFQKNYEHINYTMAFETIKNVLVIDDNETDLLIARIVIEKSGFKGSIVTKNSGKSALEYLNTIASNNELWPNIIFLDINMPVINGFAFLFEYEKLSEQLRTISRIAVLTSSDNRTDMERFLINDGVIDFVSKPISIEGFKTVVNKYSIYKI
jgi:CheY-like chemotaxis protein